MVSTSWLQYTTQKPRPLREMANYRAGESTGEFGSQVSLCWEAKKVLKKRWRRVKKTQKMCQRCFNWPYLG